MTALNAKENSDMSLADNRKTDKIAYEKAQKIVSKYGSGSPDFPKIGLQAIAAELISIDTRKTLAPSLFGWAERHGVDLWGDIKKFTTGDDQWGWSYYLTDLPLSELDNIQPRGDE